MAYELLSHPLNPGPLSRRDPRGKLLTLLLFTPAVLLHPPVLLGADLLLLFTALTISGMTPPLFLKESRGFLVILLFFFFLGLWGGGAEEFRLVLEETRAASSALFIGRLFLVYTAGVVFIRITPVSQVKSAVTYLILPLPGTLSHRLGAAIGLTFTMFPMLMEESDRIRAAQRCRGADAIRSPVKKLMAPLFPLLVNALVRSGRLADALQTRGWDSIPTDGSFKERKQRHSLRKSWRRNDTLLFIPLLTYLLLLPLLRIFQ